MTIVRELESEELENYKYKKRAFEHYKNLFDINEYLPNWKELDFDLVDLYFSTVLNESFFAKVQFENMEKSLLKEGESIKFIDGKFYIIRND
jgi:hypothetical protein